LGDAGSAANARSAEGVRTRRDVRCAERISARLRVPQECRDAARLAARWHRAVDRAPTLPPSRVLQILAAADALRRPERLDHLLETCEAAALSTPGAERNFLAGIHLRAALDVVKGVDAGAIARAVAVAGTRSGDHADAVAAAVRAARLAALRRHRQTR
jgi:tRNA nucleotidyltransferase (CCA-adding enzyme)